MYKLLIVDDEPLVQVGIKSMLNWGGLNIEIVGTAVNGQAALRLIEEQSPDIVITDIKMPVMSGLELIRLCRERYGNERPHFLILTSYEDFHMVKEAITYQVTDYLVKLELTPESLKDAICRVTEQIRRTEEKHPPAENLVHPFYDKFFIRLLNNLFESEEQFILQSRDLNLDFHYHSYVCCYGEMHSSQAAALPMEKQLALFSSSMQMLRELAGKYYPCYGLSLDTRHFALIFCFEENSTDGGFAADGAGFGTDSTDGGFAANGAGFGTDSTDGGFAAGSGTDGAGSRALPGILSGISDTLQKYYNVSFRCGIGNPAAHPQAVCDSYQQSRQACQFCAEASPVVSFEDCVQLDSGHSSFNISLFRKDLTRAFEEYDAQALSQTLDTLCELFLAHPHRYTQAMDGACNILFLAISLLQDGEQIVSGFFQDNPEGYRSIYQQTGVEQIVSWLGFFKQQLCRLFENHHKDYKNHIVTSVKKYILEHVNERLSLNEVAAVFGISPNYLSQLFGRYNDMGFSEYISSCKIQEAKRLLDEGTLKVYEVAERLGFESSFYFSKVFKKVEGISPTDYINGKP